MFMCVHLNSLLDRDMKLSYFTQVFNQGINIKSMCPNYIFELKTRNRMYYKFI